MIAPHHVGSKHQRSNRIRPPQQETPPWSACLPACLPASPFVHPSILRRRGGAGSYAIACPPIPSNPRCVHATPWIQVAPIFHKFYFPPPISWIEASLGACRSACTIARRRHTSSILIQLSNLFNIHPSKHCNPDVAVGKFFFQYRVAWKLHSLAVLWH